MRNPAAMVFDILALDSAPSPSAASEYDRVVSITAFVAVLCLCIIVGLLLRNNRWVNESITAIIIGFVFGTIVFLLSKGQNSHILRFNEELFFIYLLPPIIFNAGFQVKKKQFFHNFMTIMLFGVVGVFVSSAIITGGSMLLFPRIGFNGLDIREYLALGTIFSATDTVCTLQVLHQDETPLLYSLVFGEGVVNDATSVVLFNAIQKIDVSKPNGWTAASVFGDFLYLFLSSTVLGVAIGLLTAYAFMNLKLGRHATDREIALMVLMPYLSYMLAELLHLSGILTVFFCGIVMSHYAWHAVSEKAKITTRHVFATLSFIAETFIFLYLGMDALDTQKWKMTKTSFGTSFGIYSIILFLILVGRAVFVVALSSLSNYVSSNVDGVTITLKQQVIIWWAGLLRGAVSIALAYHQFTSSGVTWDPVHATMITSTMVVVLFSTLVFGFLTKPLIRILQPHLVREINRRQDDNQQPGEDMLTLLLQINRRQDDNQQPEEVNGRQDDNQQPEEVNGRQDDNQQPEEDMLTLLLQEDQTKGSLTLLMERPAHTIHAYWRRFDNHYMRPIFGGPVHSVS